MSIKLGGNSPTKITMRGEGDNFATQGPCPDGFHVPLNTEWNAVRNIRVALGGGSSDGTNFGIALKLPFAGYRSYSSAGVGGQGTNACYWSSTAFSADYAYYLLFSSAELSPRDGSRRSYGLSVRPFKNSPVVPDVSWTKLYGTSIEAGGIFWSSTDGLISLSSDGNTWITIADKNLGATTVWNSGDTLSETNAGKYYQWGNNYGFPRTGTIANQSTTQVDASNYGPGNYYSSDTFIKYSGRWDSTDNRNLWGKEDGNVPMFEEKEIKKITIFPDGVTEKQIRPAGWQPGANTLLYMPLNGDVLDYSGNSNNGTWYGTAEYKTVGNKQYAWFNNTAIELTTQTLSGGSTFTQSTWVKTNTNGIACLHLFGQDMSGKRSNVILNYKYSNTSYWSINDTYGTDVRLGASQTSPMYADQRVYVVYTYSSGTHQLYYNGQLYGTGAGTLNINSGQKYIGRAATAYPNYGLSEVIIENKVWSAQEISDYYNQTKGNYGL